MKKYVCIFLLIVICFSSFTGCVKNTEYTKSVENTENPYDEQTYDLVKMKAFRQQINEVKNKDLNLDLPDGITVEILKKDLLEQRQLIPFKGVLGGTPDFYSEEIIFFDDYAFIGAEDGHIGAFMVLSYTITQAGKIKWTLEAYDKGGYEHDE